MEPFVIGSLWGNLSDDNQATLVSTGTTSVFKDDLQDVWGEVSGGVNFFNPSANTSVLAKVDVTFGDGVGGKAGHARHLVEPRSPHSERQGLAAALRRSAGVTRQIVLPTSSATRSAPDLPTATPTGRPCAVPSALKNPVRTSSGGPEGRPPSKGTKITL
jgi:hypothetical protein